ncbi:MAG: tetratricopeptide repeat protein [Chloroflexi bacterium]|nr:tetratricopeptide repeat protein [Chloroflexota bacterium]
MAEDRMLQEAIDAAEQGQRTRARDLLGRLLRTNQNNVDYWLYMSSVVDSVKERIYCLENALKLDPKNESAKRGLVLLGARPPDDNITPIFPVRQREWDLGEIGLPPGTTPKEEKERVVIPTTRLLGIIFAGVIGLSLILIGIFGNPLSSTPNRVGSLTLPTRRPLGSGGPTATFFGEIAPETVTVGTSLPGPTAHTLQLDITYTATPRYVDTPHSSSEAYRSGMVAFDRGDWESAIELLEQVLDQDPGAADVRFHIGVAYMELGEHDPNLYNEAKENFWKAINVDPEFGAAYLGSAMASLALNPDAVAFEDLDAAILNDPDLGEAYIQRGIYRLNRDNPDGAMADFEEAKTLSPNSAVLFLSIAKAQLVLEQYPEALDAALIANNFEPNNLETYKILGQLYTALGQTAEALIHFQTYQLYEELDAQGWFSLGQAYLSEGYLDTALDALETALELQDTLGEINYYRGLAYLEMGDYENADFYLRNTVDLFPDWFEPQLALGRVIFETGDVGNGYLEINASTGLARTDEQFANLYYWRALALEAVGEEDVALRDWESIVGLPVEVVPEGWLRLAVQRLRDADISVVTNTAVPLSPTTTPSPTITFTPTP